MTTFEQKRQNLIAIQKQIDSLQHQLETLNQLTQDQRAVFFHRQQQFENELQKIKLLTQGDTEMSDKFISKAMTKHFETQVQSALERQQDNLKTYLENIDKGVKMQYDPQITMAKQLLDETQNFSDEEILRQVLPQVFVDDYVFLRDYTAQLKRENLICNQLIEKYKKEMEMYKEQQSDMVKEKLRLKTLLKSYKQTFQQNKKQAYQKQKEHQMFLKEAKSMQNQLSKMGSNQQAQFSDSILEREIQETENLQKLPTPIRDFVEQICTKYQYLFDYNVTKETTFRQKQQIKKVLSNSKKRSLMEEKFKITIPVSQSKEEDTGHIDVGMVIEDLQKNQVLFDAAVKYVNPAIK